MNTSYQQYVDFGTVPPSVPEQRRQHGVGGDGAAGREPAGRRRCSATAVEPGCAGGIPPAVALAQ